MAKRAAVLTVALLAIGSAAAAQERSAPAPAATRPDPVVVYQQAYRYDSGAGVPRDHSKAISLYRQAADLGSADAMLNLGHHYANGKVVPADLAQAAQWYRRASDLGNGNAMFILGVCYWAGRGLPEDQIEAYKWLDLAAIYSVNRDMDTAASARNALARVLSPEQIEDAKKRAREWQFTFERRK